MPAWCVRLICARCHVFLAIFRWCIQWKIPFSLSNFSLGYPPVSFFNKSIITCLLCNCFSYSVTGISAIISYVSHPLVCLLYLEKVSTVTEALLHHLRLLRLDWKLHQTYSNQLFQVFTLSQGRITKPSCKSNELLIKRNNNYNGGFLDWRQNICPQRILWKEYWRNSKGLRR